MNKKEKDGSAREAVQALVISIPPDGHPVKMGVFRPITEPPETAGTYNVMDDKGYISTIDYTAQGGWNTCFDPHTGEVFAEHAMDADAYGFLAWAPRLEV